MDAYKELAVALEILKSVEQSMDAVNINHNQCRRLVGFYSKVGESLACVSKKVNTIRVLKDQLLLPSLDVTLSVLQKGQLLVENYTGEDWLKSSLTTDVNQESFEAIHLELQACVQSIYRDSSHLGLEIEVPMASVVPLLYVSKGDRETLFRVDAEMDRKDMLARIERQKKSLSRSAEPTLEQRNEILSLQMASEKIGEIGSPGQFKGLPSSLRIKWSDVELLNLLGTGGSAEVWKCRWLHRDFAAKILNGANVAGLRKEIENLIHLRHPNIVLLVGVSASEDSRSTMIVMELLDCDLYTLLRKHPQPQFTLSQSINFIYQIATGMAYLHKQKIFHGDLKSLNVLVANHSGNRYELKISDFGVSEHVEGVGDDTEDFSDNTSDRLAYNIGTTRWRAPEVFEVTGGNHQPYSPKADVYSFAMICYEILARKLPYEDLDRAAELRKFVLCGGRPELSSQLPKDLDKLIRRCWDPEPALRPSFSQICEEIQRLPLAPKPGPKPSQKSCGRCCNIM